MIKKYRIDLFCAALSVVSIPLLVVNKPVINYSEEISKIELLETGGQEKIVENISYDKSDYKNIETRNIFSPNGSYGSAEGKEILTEKPYRLIGVFISGQKRAVFMKDTGDIIILNAGDKLEDGSVVYSIENLSVKLKKNDNVVEYRIFKLENEIN